MTALLDLHPDAGHPAVALVTGVHELVDAFWAAGAVPLDTGDFAGVVAELSRALRRLEAVELQVVAAADRAGVATDSGAAGTAPWLAWHTRSDPARCARDVRLAGAVHVGPTGDRTGEGGPTLPATGAALARGSVSTEHARVIAETVADLPSALTEVEVAAVEASLVSQAEELDPRSLRRAARRALAAVESDVAVVDVQHDRLVREEERYALAVTRLTWHDHGDGTTSGHFRVPTLAASILRKVIDSMTAPRRARLGASRAQAGDQGIRRDPAHERGLAFVELLEHVPTDHLHRKVAATVVITIDQEWLARRLTDAGLVPAGLDTGEELSAGEARRLACGAGIVPVVLGGRSVPVDLGRQQRLFTEAQGLAGATLHTACAADGCERPYAWCELHHRVAWSHGGRTDLADLVPLCGFHHRRIHDPGFRHTSRPDGAISFHRRT